MKLSAEVGSNTLGAHVGGREPVLEKLVPRVMRGGEFSFRLRVGRDGNLNSDTAIGSGGKVVHDQGILNYLGYNTLPFYGSGFFVESTLVFNDCGSSGLLSITE